MSQLDGQRCVGWVKTFSPIKGYGFIVDLETGVEHFVHYLELTRSTMGFKVIWRGEYVEFTSRSSERGAVALQVTGIKGGPLFCEVERGAEPVVVPTRPPSRVQPDLAVQ